MLYKNGSHTFHIAIELPPALYLRAPLQNALGKELLRQGCLLIADEGLESFTFKKLSKKANCTEATVYRYFENKHKLLLCLLSIFWACLEYEIQSNLMNIKSGKLQLENCLNILCKLELTQLAGTGFGKEIIKVAEQEGVKIHYHKELKTEHENGSLLYYIRVLDYIEQVLSQSGKSILYPRSMSTLLLDSALTQRFYANVQPLFLDKKCRLAGSSEFLYSLVFNSTKK